MVGTASADPAEKVEMRPEDMHPFILFGSSFPKDKEYTQVLNNSCNMQARRTMSLEDFICLATNANHKLGLIS